MKKVPTYLLGNILLIIMSSLFLNFFVSSLVALRTDKFTYVSDPITLIFILLGITFSIVVAKRIKKLTVADRRDEALKFAKRVNRSFIGVTIVLLLLAVSMSTITPKGFRTRSHNAAARMDLRNFYSASQLYYKQNPDGSLNVDVAKKFGFNPTYNVKLEVQDGKQATLKATSSHPSGNDTFILNNKGEITSAK